MFDKITPKIWGKAPRPQPKAYINKNEEIVLDGRMVVAPTIDNDAAQLEAVSKAVNSVYEPPRVVKASESLRGNLERSATQYGDREHQLVKEIADREAELADVRKASAAVVTALIGLEVDVGGSN